MTPEPGIDGWALKIGRNCGFVYYCFLLAALALTASSSFIKSGLSR